VIESPNREAKRVKFRNQVSQEIAEIDLRQLAFDLHGKNFRDAYLDTSLCWIIRSQVRLIREDRGWTQEELADKAGVSFATINRLEHLEVASYNPQIGTLLKLADAFDVALIVRFEAWSQYLAWLAEIKVRGVDALIPKTLNDEWPELEKWATQT